MGTKKIKSNKKGMILFGIFFIKTSFENQPLNIYKEPRGTQDYLLTQFKLDLSRNDFFQIEKKEVIFQKQLNTVQETVHQWN